MMSVTHPYRWCMVALAAVLGSGVAASEGRAASEQREPPLVEAAKKADMKAARALVARHIDVNRSEPDGTTALHWAVDGDDAAMVDLLIRSGANVKATNRYGVTPLYMAAINGSTRVMERLLKAGADAKTALPGGETTLMTAARSGKADVVKMLVAYGADVNARENARGQSALMWAAVNNNAAAIQALVEAGADLHARATGPVPPAAMAKNKTVIAMKLGGENGVASKVAEPGSTDRTANEDAAARARAEAAAAAKAGGARRNADLNPFALGAGAGGGGMYGAKSRLSNRIDAFTPLMLAAQNGSLAAVKALVAAGANVNDAVIEEGPAQGTSVLVIACANAHWEVAAYLVEHGADPNAAAQGWTALHQIARTRGLSRGRLANPVPTGKITHLELVKVLIDHGADVNARVTKPFRNDNERQRFITNGATPLVLAAKAFDHEMMRVLGKYRADVTATNVIGSNALMTAAGLDVEFVGEDSGAAEDALEAVKVALDLGIDINAANKNGDTALHGASWIGAPVLVHYLIDHGAGLGTKNIEGEGRACQDVGKKAANPTMCRGWTALTVALGRKDGFNLFTGDQSWPDVASLLRRQMIARNLSIDEDPDALKRLDEWEAKQVREKAK